MGCNGSYTMKSKYTSLKDSSRKTDDEHLPVFFRLAVVGDREKFDDLLASGGILLCDEIYSQLKELVKSRNPSKVLTDAEYADLISKQLGGVGIDAYGVWVYYPWAHKVVHLLDKDEFIELRTSRNKYKITVEEQAILSRKIIGIIGLSVGQSIALTIAMERVCGSLRLADFDTLDLSNLNRLRAGVHNIGLKKTVIAAREIAELDPYFNVEIYSDGVTADNIDSFFTANGKLDILIEVCDGLDMKILSRYKAKELHIPVVMDTNDKGMVDVERFDLEPERAVLHGLADGLNPGNMGSITGEQRLPIILKMVGGDNLSARMKRSMGEIGKTISTWPQLASSVVLGGAITTDICRRIFLDQFRASGRYYIDFEELVAD